MPARTREQRFRELERLTAPARRFIDIACQFEVYGRTPDGKAAPTGQRSRVYGGVWDTWGRIYAPDTPADNVTVLPCTAGQLAYLEDNAPHLMAVGARGGGKSESLKGKALALMADLPSVESQIVAPTYKLTRVVWGKILADLPSEWVYQIRRADREIVLINGQRMRFVSSDNPDSLRGWGGAYSLHDESQDQPDEALDIAWLSLRETDTPQMCEAGTAKAGRFRDRYDRLVHDANASIHHFTAPDNVFIPQNVYEIAAASMDPRTYRQEVLAEWVGLVDVVYEFFDWSRHARRYDDRKAVLADLYGLDAVRRNHIDHDVTSDVCKARFGRESDVVIGLDYNVSPMVACVYKLLRGDSGVGEIAWMIDEVCIDEKADALRMAMALRSAGYAESVIVADASDSRARHYKRVFRNEGFTPVNPARTNKNPDVKDRVAAMNALMLNANNDTRWFIDATACPRTAKAIERQQRDHAGKPEKGTWDHYCDAAGYPMTRLYPVANERIRSVQGRYAV